MKHLYVRHEQTVADPLQQERGLRARRLTTILPAMTLPDALETTRMHRVAGRTGARTVFVTSRPCRAPHLTISDVGLIGVGQVSMPGDVSLAHHGMLLLDVLPEFRRHVLEVLHQPLEKSITRVQSPTRARPQSLCRFSCTGDECEGCVEIFCS